MDRASLRYAETHEWVALEGEQATVGITHFAVAQLTDLVYVDLPKVGRALESREPFGEIESVKAVSDLYAPVAGEVVEVNAEVRENTASITQDPYGAGWLIKLKVPSGTSLDHLMSLAEYEKQISEEQP